MYDTRERIRRVKLRVEELENKEANRIIASLLNLSLVLSACLLGAIGYIADRGRYIATDFYGSMLMYEDAGSHVLVGVISFTVAVTITVVCIRYKEKNIQDNKKDK